VSSNSDARVILAVADEADDGFVWDQLKNLQAGMFGAGPVSIKFAYFGREGGRPSRPYIATRWVTGPDDMAELMDKARANCVCGCYVEIGDILAAAIRETGQAPVQAVIIVGDNFSGNPDAAMAHAEALRAAGTRLFLFQRISPGRHSGRTGDAFQTLAEQTGGAYFQFNPAVDRVAERLPSLLEAVSHFAIGGTRALEALDNQSATSLLKQMNTQELERQGRQRNSTEE
jgi:hypothetical protein